MLARSVSEYVSMIVADDWRDTRHETQRLWLRTRVHMQVRAYGHFDPKHQVHSSRYSQHSPAKARHDGILDAVGHNAQQRTHLFSLVITELCWF